MSETSDIRKTCVAVVDDDESLCRALCRLLRAAGLHPVAYRSAEAFLAGAKKPRFDCLVLDIQLGGMSGIELHRRLNASGSTIPVVYFTAQDESATRAAALAAGCAAYLQKTDSVEAVLEAIRRAVIPEQEHLRYATDYRSLITDYQPPPSAPSPKQWTDPFDRSTNRGNVVGSGQSLLFLLYKGSCIPIRAICGDWTATSA